jgi:hypothetical protein
MCLFAAMPQMCIAFYIRLRLHEGKKNDEGCEKNRTNCGVRKQTKMTYLKVVSL